MNSTLNMILALKLKFILIILSIGASYFLENHTRNQLTKDPDPVGLLKITSVNEGPAIKYEREGVIPVKYITPIAEPGLIMPAPNCPNPCTLGDLKLHIEL